MKKSVAESSACFDPDAHSMVAGAAEDLERIARWIQQNNPQAAKDTTDTIYEGITDLQTFPNRGREGRIESTRELVFPSLPYIGVYRLRNENIEIVRIYHAVQNWP
jgi:toxin ParE1/3/4